MELRELAELGSRLVDEVERAVVGKREQLELILLGMLADGHVLLEDVPGLAKTLTARSFAEASGLGFSRVQFTPDLLPPTSPAPRSGTSVTATSSSAPGRSSRTFSSPTRSTALRRRRRQRCSRQCRSGR